MINDLCGFRAAQNVHEDGGVSNWTKWRQTETCKCYQKDSIETPTCLSALALVFIHDIDNFMHFLLALAVHSNWVCCVNILFFVPSSILAFLTSRMSRVRIFWGWFGVDSLGHLIHIVCNGLICFIRCTHKLLLGDKRNMHIVTGLFQVNLALF